LAETEAILIISEELGYLQPAKELFNHIEELAKMIRSLVTSIKAKIDA